MYFQAYRAVLPSEMFNLSVKKNLQGYCFAVEKAESNNIHTFPGDFCAAPQHKSVQLSSKGVEGGKQLTATIFSAIILLHNLVCFHCQQLFSQSNHIATAAAAASIITGDI